MKSTKPTHKEYREAGKLIISLILRQNPDTWHTIPSLMQDVGVIGQSYLERNLDALVKEELVDVQKGTRTTERQYKWRG